LRCGEIEESHDGNFQPVASMLGMFAGPLAADLRDRCRKCRSRLESAGRVTSLDTMVAKTDPGLSGPRQLGTTRLLGVLPVMALTVVMLVAWIQHLQLAQAIHRSASAAAAEAALPKATLESILRAARRPLNEYHAAQVLLPAVTVNQRPMRPGDRLQAGDRVVISVDGQRDRSTGWLSLLPASAGAGQLTATHVLQLP